MTGMVRRLTGARGVLLSGALFFAAFWLVNVAGVPGLMRSESLGRVGILDMDYAYPPEHAHRKLAAYGTDARAAYWQFLTHVDFVYPALVGWFFCVATVAAARHAFPRRPGLQSLGVVPLLLTAADWAENVSILGMLARYPEQVPWLARLASAFTLAKAAAGIASLCLLLFLSLAAVAQWNRNRRGSGSRG